MHPSQQHPTHTNRQKPIMEVKRWHSKPKQERERERENEARGGEVMPIEISARVTQRARTVLAQMDGREILASVLGMQAAFQFAHQALQDLVCERMEILDAEEREQGPTAHEESAEEEVAVEDADESALMQAGAGVPRPLNPTWEPLAEEDRQRLEELLRAMSEQQSHVEPILFLLAAIHAAPPDNCQLSSEEEGDPGPVTIGCCARAWCGCCGRPLQNSCRESLQCSLA